MKTVYGIKYNLWQDHSWFEGILYTDKTEAREFMMQKIKEMEKESSWTAPFIMVSEDHYISKSGDDSWKIVEFQLKENEEISIPTKETK